MKTLNLLLLTALLSASTFGLKAFAGDGTLKAAAATEHLVQSAGTNPTPACLPPRAGCFSDFDCCSGVCVQGSGSNGYCF